MIRILAVIAALVCALPAYAQAPKLPAGADPQNTILLDTVHGRIVIKLRNDIAPKHAERIKQLTREGFYNNVPFHRVMDGFMAQTGDGKNFDGTGHSDHPNSPDEFSKVSFQRGMIGMHTGGDRMLPRSGRQRLDLGLQLALDGWRGQQLADDGEAQPRPSLVHSQPSRLFCHADAPLFRVRRA